MCCVVYLIVFVSCELSLFWSVLWRGRFTQHLKEGWSQPWGFLELDEARCGAAFLPSYPVASSNLVSLCNFAHRWTSFVYSVPNVDFACVPFWYCCIVAHSYMQRLVRVTFKGLWSWRRQVWGYFSCPALPTTSVAVRGKSIYLCVYRQTKVPLFVLLPRYCMCGAANLGVLPIVQAKVLSPLGCNGICAKEVRGLGCKGICT